VYKQPVFIYLPKYATLRGGAWVVVDSTINKQYIEMYADEDARGGVLEVEGTLDVKFRKSAVMKTCHRLDPVLRRLDGELLEMKSANAASRSGKTKAELIAAIRHREDQVFPVYHSIASQFADLHDAPGRMLRKGVIEDIVSWENSRAYFYWRLRRRLHEERIIRQLNSAAEQTSSGNTDSNCDNWRQLKAQLYSWVEEEEEDGKKIVADDKAFVGWVEHNSQVITERIREHREAALGEHITALLSKSQSGDITGLANVLSNLDPKAKELLSQALNA
jgi:hypothetical protein